MKDNSFSETGNTSGQRIRIRAIVIGFILGMIICTITPYNNLFKQATPLGGGHFPLAPFFILVWMTIGIALFRKIFKDREILTGKELLVSWILMVIVSGIAYTGLVRTFFINITAPFHYATVENRWDEILHPLLPKALYPQSDEAIKGLYNGIAGGREMGWLEVILNIPWDAWLRPLITWACFILLCYFVMLCLVKLISKQALENEKMNFPLLQVPQLLEEALDSNGLGKFFTNRFFIIGLIIPVLLHLLNGLHFYFPGVPQLPTLILAGPYFPKSGLFSGFYKLKMYIYPAFIGFAFLTSKQISFSFWFFFILGLLLYGFLSILGYNIPASALGITFGPALSRPEETQMIGAYVIFFLFLAWLARYHLFSILLSAFKFKKTGSSDQEWLPSSLAFWGFIFGSIGICIWLSYFGVPLLISIMVITAFFLFMLVATRIICQGGIAYFTLTAAPIDGIIAFFGSQFFTNAGLLISAVAQKVLFVDLREALMPSLMHARRVVHGLQSRKVIIGGILVLLTSGVIVSFISMLALSYKFGIRDLGLDWATRTTLSVYDNVQYLVESPTGPSQWAITFSIVGAVIMLLLVICYHRFYWWPIHPIGYLTAYSFSMKELWFCFFLGWLFNALCMRYGGIILFKKLRLLFVGLIVGDFIMGGLWALIGLFSYASYQVLPT